MINNEQIQALKAAADDIGSEEWQYMRSSNFSNGYITNSEGKTVVNVTDGDVPARYARFIELANPAAILSLLAERDADKALIAELEARTLTVNHRKHSVDEVMIISQMDREYSEGWCSANDWAIQMVREACAAAGITLVVGE